MEQKTDPKTWKAIIQVLIALLSAIAGALTENATDLISKIF